MKKIGIITIVKVNNYGAELQAFALQKKLESKGFQAEIIDYLYYKNWRYKDTKESRPFIPLSLKDRILYWVKYRAVNFLIEKVFTVFNGNIRRRLERFSSFHKEYSRFSKEFRSYPALYRERMNYDVYVAGSDQVWNPTACSSIEPYFLTFAPERSKKISYASSFGVSFIAECLHERFRGLLNNIGEISVREESGVQLVKQLTGRDATLVVDPTLLLTSAEWVKYEKLYPNMPERYVLIYQLSESEVIIDLAKSISKKRKIPVLRVCKRAFYENQNSGIQNILDAGPSEFLWLIHNAEFIITNSFHGTAFSVNYHKPFFTVLSDKKKNNARMESLLRTLKLQSRLVYEESYGSDDIGLNVDNIFTIEVDNRLNELREGSLKFLLNNI